MQKWEYLTFTAAYAIGDYLGNLKMFDNQEQPGWNNKNTAVGVRTVLNNLGEDGWELVTVMWRGTGGASTDPVYFFKRPIE